MKYEQAASQASSCKERLRAEINRDVTEFLRSGGRIEEINSNTGGRIAVQAGIWSENNELFNLLDDRP